MIVLAVLGISLYFILREEETQLTDVEKFVKEYTGVDSDNVFVYRHAEEIIRILEHGMGVVQSVNGCHMYVTYLNEVAKDKNINVFII